MFKSIFRLFKVALYGVTFQFNKAADAWGSSAGVVSAEFDEIIGEKQKRAKQFMDAVAQLMTQEEKKKQKMKATVEKLEKSERLVAGAKNKLKKHVSKLKERGLGKEAIEADAEYKRLLGFHSDFKSTLEEQTALKNELEDDLQELISTVKGHKTNLETISRELQKLKEEKGEAVAQIISSGFEKQLADSLISIGEDKTSEKLSGLRDRVSKSKAAAKLSRDISGMSAGNQEAEFLSEAGSVADDELSDFLFGGDEEEVSESKTSEKAEVATE